MSLLAAAGVAASSLAVLPPQVFAQEKGGATKGSEKGEKQPEGQKIDEDEKARLLRKLEEERAKFAEDRPRPQPPAPAALKPQQPPATTPPRAQPAAPTTIPNRPAAPSAQPATPPVLPNVDEALQGDQFVFNFTDEVDLTLLVQYVQQAFDLEMIVQDGGGLVGQKVTLMTPITVRRDQVIPFVTMLLEQRDYTIVKNSMGIYMVTPRNQIPPIVGGDPANTTRIIQTPGLKPSSLQGPIATLIAATRGGGVAGAQPIYQDDLGVIIITDTPNVARVVEEFIKELIAQQRQIGIVRFPVYNIAAASARDRVLELLGSGGASRAPGGAPVPPQLQAQALGGSLTNLPERLLVDPSTNALLFRGRPDETDLLQQLLAMVDVPNQLLSRWYPIGLKAAETVADVGRRLQLGDVSYFESSGSSTGLGGGRTGATGRLGGGAAAVQPGQAAFAQAGQTETLGAGFVIYPEAAGFIYRGTTQQHSRVEELISSLGPLSDFEDPITYEFHKLKHSKAEDVANVINDLINNQTSSGNTGGLLGRDLGSGTRSRTRELSATERTRELQRRLQGEREPQQAASAGAGGEVSEILSDDVFVLADEENNQILVKAPKRLQPQIKNLIDRLDLRRPQVLIEAKIVAITTGEDFRLAAEVQQIIGQYALTTNFGLSSVGDDGSILDPKFVPPQAGLTTALIRSKDVPFIVNTIARDTDARVVASPQVLVDDNQEAEIESKDAQPTLTTNIGSAGQQNTTSFGGFEEAGPRLIVTPQISEGGYLRLEYEIELSSFTGESSSDGVPPPKQTNRLKSESVTVPSDTTIVVGGLTQEFSSENVSGIPLLMDIPIVGHLFKDTRIQKRNITLYVFITPKIMRDPSFADLRLVTRKPLVQARVDAEIPPPTPERIDIIDTARFETEARLEEDIKEQREKYDPEPANDRKKTYRRRNQGMGD